MSELTEEQIAQRFHEAYERLAPEHGYKTRDATAVPWDQVPDNNRALMIATVADACQPLLAEVDRLNSWAGLMSVLDKHYPPDVIDGNSTDPGVRHVVLVRKLDQLGIELEAAREENQRLHARVDELDGVEQELAAVTAAHDAVLAELEQFHGAAETILQHFAVLTGDTVVVGGTLVDKLLFESGRMAGEVNRLRNTGKGPE